LKAFGSQVTAIGKKLVLFGALASTPFVIATKTFADFQDQMLTVQAVTSGTVQEFRKLNTLAKELGRTTSFKAFEVAGGQVELGRAGQNRAAILQSTDAVLSLARATGTDLPLSARIASNTLNQFGLAADKTGHVADVLTLVANRSATTLEDMGEALKDSGTLARFAREDIVSLGKSIGILANFGLRGTKAGTTLKNILTRLADPSIRKILKDTFDVETEDAFRNLRRLGDILPDIGLAMRRMGSARQLELANLIFGKRAIAGGLALGQAADMTERLDEDFRTLEGTAKRTAEAMDAGLGGALRKTLSAIEGVQLAVGEALSKELTKFLTTITKIANNLTVWIERNEQWIVTAAKGVALTVGLGAALVVVGTGLTVMGSLLGSVAGILTTVGTGLGVLVGTLSFLATPMGWVTVAAAALATAFGSAGLGGTVAFIGNRLAWLRDQFFKLRDAVVPTFRAIADAIMAGDIRGAVQILWTSIRVQWQRGVNFILGTWEDMTGRLAPLWVGFKRTFRDVTETIKFTWREFVSFVSSQWESTMQALAPHFGSAKERILSGLPAIADLFSKVATTIQVTWIRAVAAIQSALAQLRAEVLGMVLEVKKSLTINPGMIEFLTAQQHSLDIDAIRVADNARRSAEQQITKLLVEREQTRRRLLVAADRQSQQNAANEAARIEKLRRLEHEAAAAREAALRRRQTNLRRARDKARRDEAARDAGGAGFGGGPGDDRLAGPLVSGFAGTFSAEGARRLGSQGIPRKQLTELEKIASFTKAIRENLIEAIQGVGVS
jgi:TP901 family phage tail tape measure protein